MRVGKGIPPSFWKFTFIIWRELLQPEPVKDNSGRITGFDHPYIFNTTVEWFRDDFGLDTESVQDWSNAYSVSGLFRMTKGARKIKDKAGTPTVWEYNKNAGDRDWLAFILALATVVDPKDGNRIARHGEVWSAEEKKRLYVLQDTGFKLVEAKKKVREEFPGAGWPAADAFKLALALEVDNTREHRSGTPGLPPVNTHRIQRWVEQGKAKSYEEEDGSVNYRVKLPRKLETQW